MKIGREEREKNHSNLGSKRLFLYVFKCYVVGTLK